MPEPSDLLSIFLMEAWDSLATLEDGVDRLRAPAVTARELEPLLVVTHRLKGAAALHGFSELADVAGGAETLLARGPPLPANARRAAAELLTDLVDVLKKVLDGIGDGGGENADEIDAFRARYPELFAPEGPERSSPASPAAGESGELDPEILAYFGPEAAEH